MAIKANIGSPKEGKTKQIELSDDQAQAVMGKKLGDKITGKDIGLDGYEFELTGGSDYCGFPMRKDVMGTARKKILATRGVGMRTKRKGLRLRKTVAGNTVHNQTAQLNLKVIKAGKQSLFEAPAEEAPAEEKQE